MPRDKDKREEELAEAERAHEEALASGDCDRIGAARTALVEARKKRGGTR